MRLLEALGPPAALFRESAYGEQTVAFNPGDVCIMVSDGVTEALGRDWLAQIERAAGAAARANSAAGAVCDALMAEARLAPGPEGVPDWRDDRTVVVLHRGDHSRR